MEGGVRGREELKGIPNPLTLLRLLGNAHGIAAICYACSHQTSRNVLDNEGLVGTSGIVDCRGPFLPERVDVFIELRIHERANASVIMSWKTYFLLAMSSPWILLKRGSEQTHRSAAEEARESAMAFSCWKVPFVAGSATCKGTSSLNTLNVSGRLSCGFP